MVASHSETYVSVVVQTQSDSIALGTLNVAVLVNSVTESSLEKFLADVVKVPIL
jgi:hypothetical protein